MDMEGSVILDVEATPTRISKEVDATETMIERTEERFDLKPEHLAGDVAYGTGGMLGWLVEHDIDPHIPVWDRSERDDGTFMRTDFNYDKERDIYICSAGKSPTTTGRMSDGKTLYYRASKRDCDVCPFKTKCCLKSPERRVSRDINEAARDHTRSLMDTKAYRISRAERKRIETLFGEAKSILSMVRLRLRGLTGARDEFLLTATVQNLKRLVDRTARPPPQPAMARSMPISLIQSNQ
jgi:hypothetical protein